MKDHTKPNGNDIKKNPSRDYEKESQNFGTGADKNEVNPARLGNQSEVDLNRTGVNGTKETSSNDISQQGSSQNDSGLSSPTA